MLAILLLLYSFDEFVLGMIKPGFNVSLQTFFDRVIQTFMAMCLAALIFVLIKYKK